ncbi:ABC transporter ATP-binding protein [Staphylococcus sp. HMSC036D05]|uniref:ATP-binding cassette domain-containing protein n=1 Tax=Staphylococcus sp. HMSC036D05 TaxID=1715059 RepID=UPI0008A90573|nr:ABC transporter ATP-binding protein [Staphylococcus sp. HMSC036D05]OHO70032.1 ABC transporter ATP-binding protein [Staphylococcus sp. HMSC036D05]
MRNLSIEGKNISKTLNAHKIINNLDMYVPQNSITLIKGHNGSGKSVTLKIIAGLMNYQSGSLSVNGRVSYAIDYFPDNLNLTINEYFEFLLKTYPSQQTQENLNYFIQHFNLSPFLTQKIINCSKGTKQKVNMIQCLLKKADIYILDEPFSGLDQEATQFLLDYLSQLKSIATIVLTSHESFLHQKITTHILNIETGEFHTVESDKNEISQITKLVIIQYNASISKILSKYHHLNSIQTVDDKLHIQINASYLNTLLKLLLEHQCDIIEIKDVTGS